MASEPPATATYTVAWIAALPHERAAALTMLDEKHRRPQDFKKNPSDGNSYSWGRIGDHNIVIASLPDGVYGTTSAAITAACLVSSLPHIRIGLLVGIGAGITGETCDENGQVVLRQDVLLVDVVVSQPKDGRGGVVLHDVIKAKTVEGKRQTTLNGHLDKPPNALLHALGALRAEHLCEPSRMPALLALFEAKEMMKDTFVYPGQEHDPVRVALQTPDSTKTRDAPKIHYGTIASGNKMIKDRQERDDIVKWLSHNNIDAICFEMEAGGLMNAFPCIVIRGICDYADERKNDNWQRYAAATAAAFAKELLDYLDADETESENTLAQRLEKLQSNVHDIKINASQLITSATDKEMERLQDWLCPINYTPQLHEHQSNYLPGTTSWFFEDGKYRTWIEHGEGRVLLCEGHPGTGKSTLASRVVEVLQERRSSSDDPVPVLYFFFNHMMHETQTADHVLCSLLQQLIRFLPEVPNDLWRARKHGERLTLKKILVFLHTVMSDIGDLFVILDGLDEASPGTCDHLIPRLCSLTRDHQMHLLATSRCLPVIQNHFDSYPCLQVAASTSDVETYVRRRISGFGDKRMKTPHMIDATVVAVSKRCNGMFLLARLLMDILVARVATPGSLKRALESLPSGEDAYRPAYDSILQRITSQQGDFKEIGLECLAWIVFAKRPLTLAKLGHALATRSSDTGFDPEDVPQLESLPSVCAGLIVINHQNSVVSLVHTTAYEYLVAAKDKWFPKVDFFLADRCLRYLISASSCIDVTPPLENYPLGEWEDWAFHESKFEKSGPAKLMVPWPFLHYAATEWPRHAQDMETDHEDNDKFFEALSLRIATLPAKQQWWFWISRGIMFFDAHASSESVKGLFDNTVATIPQFTIWHCVAMWDLARLCRVHLESVRYVNSRYLGRTPLVLATECGSTETARVLLKHACAQGDETRGPAYLGHTVLWLAVHLKSTAFLEMLLTEASSLKCNIRDHHGRTPLMTAVLRGNAEMVEILLKSPNVDVSLRGGGETLVGIGLRNARIVEMLLAHPKIDVDECVRDGSTVLSNAVVEQAHETVGLLLSHPYIDVNKADGSGHTPLFEATNLRSGRDEVVRLLLSHPDIDVNKANRSGNTPLLHVIWLRRTETVRILLSRPDIDVNKADGSGITPLLQATLRSHRDAVQMLLLDPDIDVNKCGGFGDTALVKATAGASTQIVQMLLLHPDLDVNKCGRSGNPPLLEATAQGYTEILEKLLSHPDIDVHKKGCSGQSVLAVACERGDVSSVKKLLETTSVGLDTHDDLGMTPLAEAAVRGHAEIVRLLITKGAETAVRDNAGLMVLFLSAARGHAETVTEILRQIPKLNDISITRMDFRLCCAGYLAVRLATRNDEHSSHTQAMGKSEPDRLIESLVLLRKFHTIDALFESVEKRIERVRETEKNDLRALSWYFRRQILVYPTPPVSCDCDKHEKIDLEVFWLCLLCKGRNNEGLGGLVLFPRCVDRGAWCNHRGHCLKKVDFRPLLEGKPSRFAYPFPTRTY